jgi:hypothetical protein
MPVAVLQASAPASTEQGILLWLRVHQWAPGQSPAPVSQGLLSHLYGHNVEIDLRLRIEVRQPVLLQYMLNIFAKKKAKRLSMLLVLALACPVLSAVPQPENTC